MPVMDEFISCGISRLTAAGRDSCHCVYQEPAAAAPEEQRNDHTRHVAWAKGTNYGTISVMLCLCKYGMVL